EKDVKGESRLYACSVCAQVCSFVCVWGRGIVGSQVLTALQFVAFLPVSGGGHTDVHYVVAWRLIVCRLVGNLLL
ncbi:hypothetical protein DKP78_23705, partial [Enterococcus faecium]